MFQQSYTHLLDLLDFAGVGHHICRFQSFRQARISLAPHDFGALRARQGTQILPVLIHWSLLTHSLRRRMGKDSCWSLGSWKKCYHFSTLSWITAMLLIVSLQRCVPTCFAWINQLISHTKPTNWQALVSEVLSSNSNEDFVHYFQSLAKRFDANAAPMVYLANVIEVRMVLPTKSPRSCQIWLRLSSIS